MGIVSNFLEFKNSEIQNFIFSTINNDNSSKTNLKKLKFNLDFDIFIENETENYLHFFIDLHFKLNPETKKGYFIETSIRYFFSLKNKNKLDEKTEQQYVLFSALPMCINNLRSFLQFFTANEKFGTYILPTIDLSNLINKK